MFSLKPSYFQVIDYDTFKVNDKMKIKRVLLVLKKIEGNPDSLFINRLRKFEEAKCTQEKSKFQIV